MADVESFWEPQRLYRYRSIETPEAFDQEIEAIAEGYLFCARYNELNDPMEGLFTSSRLLRQSENYRKIRKAIMDEKANVGMCSLSEVYDHELMWAHYADQFKGICVAYSLWRLLKHLPKEVAFVRLYYNEVEPTVRSGKKHPEDLARMILSHKNYRWLYEREWRMFSTPGKASYSDVSCVARVYLGSRMASATRQRLMEKLKGLGIKTSDMIIDKYFLSSKPNRDQSTRPSKAG